MSLKSGTSRLIVDPFFISKFITMDSDSPDPVSRGLAACAARGGGGTPSISKNSNDLGGNVVGENSSRVSPTEVLVNMSNDRSREDEQAVGDLIDLTTVLDQSSVISSSLEVRTGSTPCLNKNRTFL